MTRYAKMTNGTEGEMLSPLPVSTRFKTDKYDVGRSARWMDWVRSNPKLLSAH